MRGTISLAVFAAMPLASMSVQAKTVEIINQRDEKVKFCAYRSDDKSLVRPRECFKLGKNQKLKWNRGEDRFDFDVRVFEAGVFELPICLKREVPHSYRVEIAARSTGGCVIAHQRAIVPATQRVEGESVLVNSEGDDFWYPATILGLTATSHRLLLANGRLVEALAEHILDDDIGAGSRVFGNWKRQGRWYSGRVLSRKGDRLMIKYDDGWTEEAGLATVRIASEDIMKLGQPSGLLDK